MIFQLLLVVATVLCLPMPAAAVTFTDWWTTALTGLPRLPGLTDANVPGAAQNSPEGAQKRRRVIP